jgi:serine/threonine protein kinase
MELYEQGGGEHSVTYESSSGPKGHSELRLINQGAYGCIFYPGIRCDGKKDMPNFITKIQKHAKTVQNENAISNLVRTIKGYTKYFAPIVKQCPIKLTQLKTSDVKECKVLSDASAEDAKHSTYISNKIRYVGKLNLRKYVLKKTEDKKSMSTIYKTHLYILKSLQKLVEKQIVHYDIKYNNIMFDLKLHVPIIIDFGLSIHLPNLSPSTYRNAFYVYETYTYWCMDIMLCNYIFRVITYEESKHIKITKEELTQIYMDFMYGSQSAYEKPLSIENDAFNLNNLTDKSTYQDFKEKYTKYYNKFVGKTWFELYEHLIQYANTWDNYSIAITYLLIMDDIYAEHPEIIRHMEEKQHAKDYVKYLIQIVFSMPDERPSLVETLTHIRKY